MKILFYNWVDYLDAEKRGGGVALYQKNMIEALSLDEDLDCYFLSSGISYDLLSNAPRWERVRHGPRTNGARRYEIVNSGCLSPSHHSFGHETQLSHGPTEAAFLDFLGAHGPFDIVHFNNLEGLPARVLALKERFPETRVVYSLHNYYPFCPQVNLWHKERETCRDYQDGRKCADCLPFRHDAGEVRQANAVAYKFKRAGVSPGTIRFDRLFRPAVKVSREALPVLAKMSAGAREVQAFSETAQKVGDGSPLLEKVEPEHRKFRRRREAFVDLLNQNCDRILCVSARVAELASEMGLRDDLLDVAYIGSRQSDWFAKTEPRSDILHEDGTITLGYLGYMRRDKGFFFLLEALEALPQKIAERVHLVVCARKGDARTMTRLRELGGVISSVRHADGYSHENLDDLLSEIDVGVIPVLWEDNLPQVAIEMHARHIPLITSDLGGARELGNTPPMVFQAGNIPSFHALLGSLLAGKFDADAYWSAARAPVSMESHRDKIRALYDELCAGRRTKELDETEATEDYDPGAGVVPMKQASGL